MTTGFIRTYASKRMLPILLAVLLPGIARSWEAGVPVVKTGGYAIAHPATAHRVGSRLPGATPQEQQQIAWLDNRRVIFGGYIENQDGTGGLHIWDVLSNAVTQYSKDVRFCFADGYIVAYGSAQVRNDTERTALTPMRVGMFGQENEVVCDSKTGKGCLGSLNMSCKPREYGGQPLGKESSVVIELRSGDGAIVSTAAGELPDSLEKIRKYYSRPLMLVSKRYPAGKALPITRLEEIIPWRSAYSAYAERYVFLTQRPPDGEPARTTPWPKGLAQPVYLMDIDGSVTSIQVPWRVEAGMIHLAMPARAGLIYQAGGSNPNDWGGLFLYDNREVWSLDRGRVETFAVSPDGCRVAYAIINDFGKIKNVRFNNIKLINFCEGGK